MTDSAVKYERGDDGIVVLTLDDPTASANTMNDLYRESMAAAVDRLYAEKDDLAGVVITSAKKTFFAGGNLKNMLAATPDERQEAALALVQARFGHGDCAHKTGVHRYKAKHLDFIRASIPTRYL